jgi:hypothetical protein
MGTHHQCMYYTYLPNLHCFIGTTAKSSVWCIEGTLSAPAVRYVVKGYSNIHVPSLKKSGRVYCVGRASSSAIQSWMLALKSQHVEVVVLNPRQNPQLFVFLVSQVYNPLPL